MISSFQPKVLCIDDDPAITTALRLRLRHYDLDVRTAADGTEGLWQAINEPPDVIITDLRMPHGEGDYVVECLKARSDTCDIPVIVLTGKRDQQLHRWMRALGVKHYLRKPLKIDELLEALGRYIDLHPCSDRASLAQTTR